uniref:Uncharacterized protein n=1 Tax=Octopus bimaculoides TaxID=37653 RepID=A0A0L8IDP7_OCTBM|eukprot:XP_014774221.1 PREDICTED: uncharacterized protein LOC106871953 [Octopus bimaculoides]
MQQVIPFEARSSPSANPFECDYVTTSISKEHEHSCYSQQNTTHFRQFSTCPLSVPDLLPLCSLSCAGFLSLVLLEVTVMVWLGNECETWMGKLSPARLVHALLSPGTLLLAVLLDVTTSYYCFNALFKLEAGYIFICPQPFFTV